MCSNFLKNICNPLSYISFTPSLFMTLMNYLISKSLFLNNYIFHFTDYKNSVSKGFIVFRNYLYPSISSYSNTSKETPVVNLIIMFLISTNLSRVIRISYFSISTPWGIFYSISESLDSMVFFDWDSVDSNIFELTSS